MKNTIFTMCMVALSTVGFSQGTQQYFTSKVSPNPHPKYIYTPGSELILNHLWDENWDGREKVGLETLAYKTEKNVKLQKTAHAFIGLGFTMTIPYALSTTPDNFMRGLAAGGSILTLLGGVQLLSVNAGNTKITFALTHPVEMSN